MIPFIPPKRSHQTTVVSRENEKRVEGVHSQSAVSPPELLNDLWKRMKRPEEGEGRGRRIGEEREHSFSALSPCSSPHGNSPCLPLYMTPSLGQSPSTYLPLASSSDGNVSISIDRVGVQEPSCRIYPTASSPPSREQQREGIPCIHCSMDSSSPSFSCDPITFSTQAQRCKSEGNNPEPQSPPLPLLPRLRQTPSSSPSSSQLSLLGPASFPLKGSVPHRFYENEDPRRSHSAEAMSLSSVTPSSSCSSVSASPPPFSFSLVPPSTTTTTPYTLEMPNEDHGSSVHSNGAMRRSGTPILLGAPPPWQHFSPSCDISSRHPHLRGSEESDIRGGRRETTAHSPAIAVSSHKKTGSVLLQLIQDFQLVISFGGTESVLRLRSALRNITEDVEKLQYDPSYVTSFSSSSSITSCSPATGGDSGSHSFVSSPPRLTVLGLPHSGKGLVLSFMMRETCDLIIPPLSDDLHSSSFSSSFSAPQTAQRRETRRPPPASVFTYPANVMDGEDKKVCVIEKEEKNNGALPLQPPPSSRPARTPSVGKTPCHAPQALDSVPQTDSETHGWEDPSYEYCVVEEKEARNLDQAVGFEKLKITTQRKENEKKEGSLQPQEQDPDEKQKTKTEEVSCSVFLSNRANRKVSETSLTSSPVAAKGDDKARSTKMEKKLEANEMGNENHVPFSLALQEGEENAVVIAGMASLPCPSPPSFPSPCVRFCRRRHPPPVVGVGKQTVVKIQLEFPPGKMVENRIFEGPTSLERGGYAAFGSHGKTYPLPLQPPLSQKREAAVEQEVFHSRYQLEIHSKRDGVTTPIIGTTIPKESPSSSNKIPPEIPISTTMSCESGSASSVGISPSSQAICGIAASLKSIRSAGRTKGNGEWKHSRSLLFPSAFTFGKGGTSVICTTADVSGRSGGRENTIARKKSPPKETASKSCSAATSDSSNRRKTADNDKEYRKAGDGGVTEEKGSSGSRERLYVLPRSNDNARLKGLPKLSLSSNRSEETHVVPLPPFLLSAISGRRKLTTPLAFFLPHRSSSPSSARVIPSTTAREHSTTTITGNAISFFSTSDLALGMRDDPLQNDVFTERRLKGPFSRFSGICHPYSPRDKEREESMQERQGQFWTSSPSFLSDRDPNTKNVTGATSMMTTANVGNASKNPTGNSNWAEAKNTTPAFTDPPQPLLPSSFPAVPFFFSPLTLPSGRSCWRSTHGYVGNALAPTSETSALRSPRCSSSRPRRTPCMNNLRPAYPTLFTASPIEKETITLMGNASAPSAGENRVGAASLCNITEGNIYVTQGAKKVYSCLQSPSAKKCDGERINKTVANVRPGWSSSFLKRLLPQIPGGVPLGESSTAGSNKKKVTLEVVRGGEKGGSVECSDVNDLCNNNLKEGGGIVVRFPPPPVSSPLAASPPFSSACGSCQCSTFKGPDGTDSAWLVESIKPYDEHEREASTNRTLFFLSSRDSLKEKCASRHRLVDNDKVKDADYETLEKKLSPQNRKEYEEKEKNERIQEQHSPTSPFTQLFSLLNSTKRTAALPSSSLCSRSQQNAERTSICSVSPPHAGFAVLPTIMHSHKTAGEAFEGAKVGKSLFLSPLPFPVGSNPSNCHEAGTNFQVQGETAGKPIPSLSPNSSSPKEVNTNLVTNRRASTRTSPSSFSQTRGAPADSSLAGDWKTVTGNHHGLYTPPAITNAAPAALSADSSGESGDSSLLLRKREGDPHSINSRNNSGGNKVILPPPLPPLSSPAPRWSRKPSAERRASDRRKEEKGEKGQPKEGHHDDAIIATESPKSQDPGGKKEENVRNQSLEEEHRTSRMHSTALCREGPEEDVSFGSPFSQPKETSDLQYVEERPENSDESRRDESSSRPSSSFIAEKKLSDGIPISHPKSYITTGARTTPPTLDRRSTRMLYSTAGGRNRWWELQYFDGIPIMHVFSSYFYRTTMKGQTTHGDLEKGPEELHVVNSSHVVMHRPFLLESTIWECVDSLLPPSLTAFTTNDNRGEKTSVSPSTFCNACIGSFISPFCAPPALSCTSSSSLSPCVGHRVRAVFSFSNSSAQKNVRDKDDGEGSTPATAVIKNERDGAGMENGTRINSSSSDGDRPLLTIREKCGNEQKDSYFSPVDAGETTSTAATSLSTCLRTRGGDSLKKSAPRWNITNTNSTVEITLPNDLASRTALFISSSPASHTGNNEQSTPLIGLSKSSDAASQQETRMESKKSSTTRKEIEELETRKSKRDRSHEKEIAEEESETVVEKNAAYSSNTNVAKECKTFSAVSSSFTPPLSAEGHLQKYSFLPGDGVPIAALGEEVFPGFSSSLASVNHEEGKAGDADVTSAGVCYRPCTWKVTELNEGAWRYPVSEKERRRVESTIAKHSRSFQDGRNCILTSHSPQGKEIITARGSSVPAPSSFSPLPSLPSLHPDFVSSHLPSVPCPLDDVSVTQQGNQAKSEFLSELTLGCSPPSSEYPYGSFSACPCVCQPKSSPCIGALPIVGSDVLMLCIREEDVYQESPEVLDASLALLFGHYGIYFPPAAAQADVRPTSPSSPSCHSSGIYTPSEEGSPSFAPADDVMRTSTATTAIAEGSGKILDCIRENNTNSDYIHARRCKPRQVTDRCSALSSLQGKQAVNFAVEKERSDPGSTGTEALKCMKQSDISETISTAFAHLHIKNIKELAHSKKENNEGSKVDKQDLERGQVVFSPQGLPSYLFSQTQPASTSAISGGSPSVEAGVSTLFSQHGAHRYTGSHKSSAAGSSGEPFAFPEISPENDVGGLPSHSDPIVTYTSPSITHSFSIASSSSSMPSETSRGKNSKAFSVASGAAPLTAYSERISKKPRVSPNDIAGSLTAIRQALSSQTLFVITKFSQLNDEYLKEKDKGKVCDVLINPIAVARTSREGSKPTFASSWSSSGSPTTSSSVTSPSNSSFFSPDNPTSLPPVSHNVEMNASSLTLPGISDGGKFFANKNESSFHPRGEKTSTTAGSSTLPPGATAESSDNIQRKAVRKASGSLFPSPVDVCYTHLVQSIPSALNFNSGAQIETSSSCSPPSHCAAELKEYVNQEKNDEERREKMADVSKEVPFPSTVSPLSPVRKSVLLPVAVSVPFPARVSSAVSQKVAKGKRRKRRGGHKRQSLCSDKRPYQASSLFSSNAETPAGVLPGDAAKQDYISLSLPKNAENESLSTSYHTYMKAGSTRVLRNERNHCSSCQHRHPWKRERDNNQDSGKYHGNRKRWTLTPESLPISPMSTSCRSFNSSFSSSSDSSITRRETDLHCMATTTDTVEYGRPHPTAQRFQRLMKERYGITVHQWQIICPFHPLQSQLARDVLAAFFAQQLQQQEQAGSLASAPVLGNGGEGRMEDVAAPSTRRTSSTEAVALKTEELKEGVHEKGNDEAQKNSVINIKGTRDLALPSLHQEGGGCRGLKAEGGNDVHSQGRSRVSSLPHTPATASVASSSVLMCPSSCFFPGFPYLTPQLLQDDKKSSLSASLSSSGAMNKDTERIKPSRSNEEKNSNCVSYFPFQIPYFPSFSFYSFLNNGSPTWYGSLAGDPTTVLRMAVQTYMSWIFKENDKDCVLTLSNRILPVFPSVVARILEEGKEGDQTTGKAEANVEKREDTQNEVTDRNRDRKFNALTGCNTKKEKKEVFSSAEQDCHFSIQSSVLPSPILEPSIEGDATLLQGKRNSCSTDSLLTVVQHAKNVLWPCSGAGHIVFLVRWIQQQAASYRLSHCATSLATLALSLSQHLPLAAIKLENAAQAERENLLQQQATLHRLRRLSETLADFSSPIFSFTSGVAVVFEKIQDGFASHTEQFLRDLRAMMVQCVWKDFKNKQGRKAASRIRAKNEVEQRTRHKRKQTKQRNELCREENSRENASMSDDEEKEADNKANDSNWCSCEESTRNGGAKVVGLEERGQDTTNEDDHPSSTTGLTPIFFSLQIGCSSCGATTKAYKRFKEHLTRVHETYIVTKLDQRLCAMRRTIFLAELHHKEKILKFLEQERREKENQSKNPLQMKDSLLLPKEKIFFSKEDENNQGNEKTNNEKKSDRVAGHISNLERVKKKGETLSNYPHLVRSGSSGEGEEDEEGCGALASPPDSGTVGVARDSVSMTRMYTSLDGQHVAASGNTIKRHECDLNSCCSNTTGANEGNSSKTGGGGRVSEGPRGLASSLGTKLGDSFSSPLYRSCGLPFSFSQQRGNGEGGAQSVERLPNSSKLEKEDAASFSFTTSPSSILGFPSKGHVVALVPVTAAHPHKGEGKRCAENNKKDSHTAPSKKPETLVLSPEKELSSSWTPEDLARGSAFIEPGFSKRIHHMRSKRRKLEKELLSVLAPLVTEIINIYLAFLNNHLPSIRLHMREGLGEMLDALQVASLVIEEAHQQLTEKKVKDTAKKKNHREDVGARSDGAGTVFFTSSSSHRLGSPRKLFSEEKRNLTGCERNHSYGETHSEKSKVDWYPSDLVSSSPHDRKVSPDRSLVSLSHSIPTSRSSSSLFISSFPSSSSPSSPSTVSPLRSKKRKTPLRTSCSSSSSQPRDHPYLSLSSLHYRVPSSPSMHLHHRHPPESPRQPHPQSQNTERRPPPHRHSLAHPSSRQPGLFDSERVLTPPSLSASLPLISNNGVGKADGEGKEEVEVEEETKIYVKDRGTALRDLFPALEIIETSSSLLHITSTPRLRDFVTAFRAAVCEDVVRALVKVQQYRQKYQQQQHEQKVRKKQSLDKIQKLSEAKEGNKEKEKKGPLPRVLSSTKIRCLPPSEYLAHTGVAITKEAALPVLVPSRASCGNMNANHCMETIGQERNFFQVLTPVPIESAKVEEGSSFMFKAAEPSPKDSLSLSRNSVSVAPEVEEVEKDVLQEPNNGLSSDEPEVAAEEEEWMGPAGNAALASFNVPAMVFTHLPSLQTTTNLQEENVIEESFPSLQRYLTKEVKDSEEGSGSDFICRKAIKKGRKVKDLQRGKRVFPSSSQSLCFVSSSFASPLSTSSSAEKKESGVEVHRHKDTSRVRKERGGTEGGIATMRLRRYEANESIRWQKSEGRELNGSSYSSVYPPESIHSGVAHVGGAPPSLSSAIAAHAKREGGEELTSSLPPLSLLSKEEEPDGKENEQREIEHSIYACLPTYELAKRTQEVLAPWVSAMPPPPPRSSLRANHLKLLASFIRGGAYPKRFNGHYRFHCFPPHCHQQEVPHRRFPLRYHHQHHHLRGRGWRVPRNSSTSSSLSCNSAASRSSSSNSSMIRSYYRNGSTKDVKKGHGKGCEKVGRMRRTKMKKEKTTGSFPSVTVISKKASVLPHRLLALSTTPPPPLSFSSKIEVGKMQANEKSLNASEGDFLFHAVPCTSPCVAAAIEAAPQNKREISDPFVADSELCNRLSDKREGSTSLQCFDVDTSINLVGEKESCPRMVIKDREEVMQQKEWEREETRKPTPIDLSPRKTLSTRAARKSTPTDGHHKEGERKWNELDSKEKEECVDEVPLVAAVPSTSFASLPPSCTPHCTTPAADTASGLSDGNNSYSCRSSPSARPSPLWKTRHRYQRLWGWRKSVPTVYQPRRSFLVQPSFWVLLDVIDEALLFSPFTPWLEVEMQVYKERVETALRRVQTKLAETISEVSDAVKEGEHSLRIFEKKIRALTSTGASSLSKELEHIFQDSTHVSNVLQDRRDRTYQALYRKFLSNQQKL